MTKFIIHRDERGYGVWHDEPNWRECNSLNYYKTREQAEAYIEYREDCDLKDWKLNLEDHVGG